MSFINFLNYILIWKVFNTKYHNVSIQFCNFFMCSKTKNILMISKILKKTIFKITLYEIKL